MTRIQRVIPWNGRGHPGLLGAIWEWSRSAWSLVQVRLRIPIVLVVAALVVGRWDVIRNHWERLTRPAPVESTAGRAVSSDTEYFCPMDQGVVSDWPGRCGICNMGLVRRKRGDALLLPEGVVARMQLSPYRIQLAGIRTTPVGYRTLAREWESSGVIDRKVDPAGVHLEVPSREFPWVELGQAVDVACADLPGVAPLVGRVRTLERGLDGGWECHRLSIAIDKSPPEVRDGMLALVRFRVPVAALEPFRSQPRSPLPVAAGEPRQVYACPDHPDTIALEPGRCPIDRNPREPTPLGEHQRLRWWCPTHPAVTASRPGAVCPECSGMALQPRVVAYAPPGQVLAVPQSAVVDAGSRKVVFVETMSGMFDGVEVVLGPRCGDEYPVVRGLEAGQKVAIAGAFLLDAETRLNPSLAAGYFGATGTQRAPIPTQAAATNGNLDEPAAAIRRLAPEDRALAERQKVCPVTGMPLGSMGTPRRLVVSGRVVLLCCSGCESKLLREPAKYLAKLPAPASHD
jgi:hypothetical protein